jgi:hypothetical protein
MHNSAQMKVNFCLPAENKALHMEAKFSYLLIKYVYGCSTKLHERAFKYKIFKIVDVEQQRGGRKKYRFTFRTDDCSSRNDVAKNVKFSNGCGLLTC